MGSGVASGGNRPGTSAKDKSIHALWAAGVCLVPMVLSVLWTAIGRRLDLMLECVWAFGCLLAVIFLLVALGQGIAWYRSERRVVWAAPASVLVLSGLVWATLRERDPPEQVSAFATQVIEAIVADSAAYRSLVPNESDQEAIEAARERGWFSSEFHLTHWDNAGFSDSLELYYRFPSGASLGLDVDPRDLTWARVSPWPPALGGTD